MALIQISNQSTKSLGKKSTIRFTQSICPDCNMILDAEVFERDAKVYTLALTNYIKNLVLIGKMVKALMLQM